MKQTKEDKKIIQLLQRDMTEQQQKDMIGLSKDDDLDVYLQVKWDKF